MLNTSLKSEIYRMVYTAVCEDIETNGFPEEDVDDSRQDYIDQLCYTEEYPIIMAAIDDAIDYML